MTDGIHKRVVLIKDVPSNIIEEAIIILKGDPPSNNEKAGRQTMAKGIYRDQRYLIKEAEMVINEYIKHSQPGKPASENNQSAGKHHKKFITNTIINLALVGSIALLIFMATRLI